ncbi:hypothetical protein N0V90_013086 [Kalmusia sp. IMI 367209]|nr:hypothetical protein N0V90_013086 [Kalmusia sp. IMI 367209]
MSHAGVNMAITQDGEAYNKLRRPDDYLASLKADPPPKSELLLVKRKFEDVDAAAVDSNQQPAIKRFREERAPKSSASDGKGLAGDTRRIFRPIKENGMQTMFPGLDDDDSSDEMTRDALAYLRSVRSEASNIPTLLVAPPNVPENGERDRFMYNNGVGDHRAVYHDGTWVAVDDDGAGGYYDDCDDWSQTSVDLDPQVAYYQSLLARYEALRQTLAKADPKELAALVEANPEKYTDVTPPFHKPHWRWEFDNKYPTPACVAQIDERNLYRALEFVAEVLARNDTISKQKSCWIWTLLSMAGDVGTLDYYKVGRIRELGHKAGQLSIRLRSGKGRNLFKDDNEEDVENWNVDGEGTDGQYDGSDEHQLCHGAIVQDEMLAQEEKEPGAAKEVENINRGVQVVATQNGAQYDGSVEQAAIPRTPEKVNNSDVTEDVTSGSEDEGEIEDDGPQSEDGPVDMEAARARLLAQLGDRLVTTSIPDPIIPPHQLKPNQQTHGEPRQGGRHRHNGKVCKDLSCQVNKRRQETHRKAGLRAAQSKATNARNPASPRKTSEAGQPEANEQYREARGAKLGAGEEVRCAYDEPPEGSKSLPSGGIKAEGVVLLNQVQHVEATGAVSKEIDTKQDTDKDLNPESGSAHTIDLNTRVTIDMILTVVGECYGQKDLLRFREVW